MLDEKGEVLKIHTDEYYEQMLVLTAISSYNREEDKGYITGKQAMLWREDPDINKHCIAYEASLIGWQKFLYWKMTFQDFCERIHEIYMLGTTQFGLEPWRIRKSTVFIAGESGEVHDALFINPSPVHIEKWLQDIGEFIKKALDEKTSDIKVISGKIHYLLTVLHPFQDGNGRLARILGITFVETFGMKDSRGFTFLAELLKSKNGEKTPYQKTVWWRNEEKLTQKIRNSGIEKEYHPDGKSYFIWNKNLDFQDYIEELDLDWPSQAFVDILNLVEEYNPLLEVIINIFLKAKTLSGDHKLIWKFITRLFQSSGEILEGKESTTMYLWDDILSSVITQIDGKLKSSSVRNFLILIQVFQEDLKRVWITIQVHESFFTYAERYWILPSDIVSIRIKSKLLDIIKN